MSIRMVHLTIACRVTQGKVENLNEVNSCVAVAIGSRSDSPHTYFSTYFQVDDISNCK